MSFSLTKLESQDRVACWWLWGIPAKVRGQPLGQGLKSGSAVAGRFGDRANWGLGLSEAYLLNPDLLLGLYCAAVPCRSSVGL